MAASKNTRSRTTYKKSSPKRKGKNTGKNNGVLDEVLLVVILAFSVLLLFSTFGLLGNIGKAIGSVLFGLFGVVAYIVPFFFAFALFFTVVNKGKRIAKIKIGAAVLFLLMLCCLAQLTIGHSISLPAGEKINYFYTIHAATHKSGGLFGGVISHFLKKFLGAFGCWIIVITLSIISGVLFTERSFFGTLKKGSENLYEDARRMKEYRSKQAEVYEIERAERNERNRERDERRKAERQRRLAEQDAKREASINARRERAEAARIAREENAQKRRDEEKALYLKQQAEEQLKKEERRRQEELEAQKSTDDYSDYVDSNTDYQDNNDASYDDVKEPRTLGDIYKAPEKEPEIMTFSGDSSRVRRTDNKVSGVMPQTKLFDLTQTNGDIREIVPEFDGSTIDLDDRIIHTEHRINISESEYAIKDAYERDVYIEEPADITDEYDDVSRVYETVNYDEATRDINLPEEPLWPRRKENISSERYPATDETPAENIVSESIRTPDNVAPAYQAEMPKPRAVRPAPVKTQNTASAKAPGQDGKPFRFKGKYKFPPVNLLNEIERKNGLNSKDELRETGDKLRDILKTFGVNVTITGALRGPSVTRYEIQPEVGVKVSKIVSLTDDIKMALAATDIRMEAPIPGKSAIGIEVPNRENTAVQYRELVESRTFKDAKSKISFAVGKDLNGQVIVTDIAKMPHVLIAGATGSGKSVCINTLIMSILYKAHPDDVKLIMVDPKVVELSVYNGIPHLLTPVVTDPKKANAALQWAVNEMMRRYQLFEQEKVRDMAGYNKIVEDNPGRAQDEGMTKLPQIVIIVDELADLMMVASKEVEESICRLAQLARAAGIHLILATQRPSVNVVTGLIKANMPSRIAFAVSSGIDSRTILDTVGAEKLLGKGDMLFYPQSYTKPARLQGAFVSDDEVKRVVDFIKNQIEGVPYDADAQQFVDSNSASGSNTGSAGFSAPEQDNGFDPLFYEAGKTIIEKQKASIGFLQRVHKIGFNRAARIMDQLADAGVVGAEDGTKARNILMTIDEFNAFIKENNQ